MVSEQVLEITNEKIHTLQEIEPVNSFKVVQNFLGFSNFYRLFIKDYS